MRTSSVEATCKFTPIRAPQIPIILVLTRHYRDIMDREPSGGDVNKMIAGSINEGMDWKMSGATLPQTSFVSSEGRSTEQPYSGETSRHVSASASTGFHRRSYPPSDHGNSRQSYTNSGSTSIGQPSDGHARSRSSVESSYPHSTSSAVSPPFLRDPFSGATSTHTPQDQLGRELDLTPKEGNRD
jgi:hypothetical protein